MAATAPAICFAKTFPSRGRRHNNFGSSSSLQLEMGEGGGEEETCESNHTFGRVEVLIILILSPSPSPVSHEPDGLAPKSRRCLTVALLCSQAV